MDDRLRELHRDAHAGERAPAFREMWGRGRRRSLVPLLATVLVAVAVLVIALRPRPHPVARQALPAIPAFHSPTDFLLETPGLGLLRDVPSLSKGVIE